MKIWKLLALAAVVVRGRDRRSRARPVPRRAERHEEAA